MSLDTGPDLPPAIPSETRARGVSPVLIVAMIAFVAGLALMALGMRWWLNERAEPAPVEAALTVPTEQPSPNDPVALQARADTLTMRIAELERRLDDVDTGSRTASGFASRAEGLMVAFAARRALDRGLALGYIEDQLRLRFAESEPQAVAVVTRNAREPVTIGDLREALDTIAPSLIRTDLSDGWGPAIRRSLGSLIVIRQRGSQSPRPADRLERARQRLNEGQVEGAIAEIERLPGANEAQSWMLAARRYVNARRALDRIETAAIQGQGRLILPAAPPIQVPDLSTILPGNAAPIDGAPAPGAAPGTVPPTN